MKLDRDQNGNVTVQEFITSFLEEEEFAKSKIISLNRLIEENNNQIKDMTEKRREAMVRG